MVRKQGSLKPKVAPAATSSVRIRSPPASHVVAQGNKIGYADHLRETSPGWGGGKIDGCWGQHETGADGSTNGEPGGPPFRIKGFWHKLKNPGS